MDINNANDFLHGMNLLEPPMIRRMLTWTNGQADPIWLKLDQFLVNVEWTILSPKMIQKCLPRVRSNHVPIRLELGKHVSSPRPFRYELAWFTASDFHELVVQWWGSLAPTGCGAFVIAKKVTALRSHFRRWAKLSFGSIKLKS